jgi:hypothetical protein
MANSFEAKLLGVLGGIRHLEPGNGAKAIVIPCNSAHMWYDQMASAARLPDSAHRQGHHRRPAESWRAARQDRGHGDGRNIEDCNVPTGSAPIRFCRSKQQERGLVPS